VKHSMSFLHRSEKGQGMVELALIFPVLLILVLGIIDLGMGFRTYIVLSNAAREGARWVAIYPTDPSGALDRVSIEADTVGLANTGFSDGGIAVSFTPNQTTYTEGQDVTVAIEHDFPLLFGFVTGLPDVPFHTEATMTVLYPE
jgi:Flp pilus assembly protein TadG